MEGPDVPGHCESSRRSETRVGVGEQRLMMLCLRGCTLAVPPPHRYPIGPERD